MNPILHIPHSSQKIPSEFRRQFLLGEGDLDIELLKMTDHFTDELFIVEGATALVFPVSRLLVDVERFEDDAREPMAVKGMGVLYAKTHDGRPLRRALTEDERQHLLETYYRPHHGLLTAAVDRQLRGCGAALIIDCHSFPSRSLPYQDRCSREFPQICIGLDDSHTPPKLRDAAVELFREKGFTVATNYPFAGALTPLKHFQRDLRVMSIMIEVRRDLYMDERTGRRDPHYKSLREALASAASAITAIAEEIIDASTLD